LTVLRVASWNVYDREADARRIVDFVRAADADAVALQELTPAHLEALRQDGGYHIAEAEDFADGDTTSYLALLTREPPGDVRRVTHNTAGALSPSLVGRFMRWRECLQSLSLNVRVGDAAVRVVNLHLTCAAPPVRRVRELGELDSHLVPGPLVVCGDFNSFARPRLNPLIGWAFGFGWRDYRADDLAQVAEFAARHGLTSVFESAVTLPRLRLALDHMLVRDLSCRDREIVRDRRGSDHRPLIADLVL